MDYMKLDIQMFADGKVVIDTELNTKNFENGLNRMQSTSQKAGSTIKNIVAGLGITKLISKGIELINSSIDDAVKRVDTLNNFPKVMKNLGISAKDADKEINRMSEALAGLPTTLDQGAMAVQRFTSKNNNVKKSTDIFLALNNALLAGGASTEIQATALEQLSQSYAKGKPDMMEWRTAMTAMPAQLKQVAEAMGYVNADELGEALRNGTVSMDDFMDKVVELNKKGTKGFQSFEKQARNSTGGISTAVTVAKTQVVKGVADIITGLDKGLKKSGTSISKIFADLGKGAKQALDKVATALSKINFAKLGNTLKTLIPIVGTLTAAFVAYNVALKAIEIKNAIINFGSLAKQFITMIPSINGANASMVALNTTMSISPIGLVVAGVAGLTAGLVLLGNATRDTTNENMKIIETLENYNKVMEDAEKAKQSYLDKNMSEIAGAKALYQELTTLVDENGKVKEGYEDRVNYIVNELNSALGTEIKMNNGVIQGYKDIKSSIGQVIEAKRAKVLLDAEEKKYNEAKNQQATLEENYAKAMENVNSKTEKRNELLGKIQKQYGLTNEQLKQVEKNYSYIDENGKKVNLDFETLVEKLKLVDGQLGISNNRLKEAGKAFEDNEKLINDYDYALEQLKTGNYDAVLKIYEDTANYNGKTNEDTKNKLDGRLEILKQYRDKLNANEMGYNEEQLRRAKEQNDRLIQETENQQKDINAKIKAGQSTVLTTWDEARKQQLTGLEKSKPEFSRKGGETILSYSNGIKSKRQDVSNSAKQVTNSAITEFGKAEGQARIKGNNTSQGFANGMTALVGNVARAASSVASAALRQMQKTLDEHSPSRKTMKFGRYFSEGFAIGVDKEKSNSLKTVQSYGQDMLDELNGIYAEMQRTVDMETGKMTANVQTSGTYQVAMTGNPTFNLRDNSTSRTELVVDGRKLAEVVNTQNRNREVAKS